MSTLVSSDIATAGLWRALIVQPIDQGRFSVYIPALHKAQMPFKDIANPKLGLIETNEKGEFTTGGLTMTINDYPIANSCVWQGRTVMATGECVWLMFENGDVNYPIIMGQVGSNVEQVWDLNSMIAQEGGSYGDVEYSGNDTLYVFQRLIQAKYPNAAACGILANMEAESGIKSNNLEDKYEASLGYTDKSYTEAVDSGTYTREQFCQDSAGYGLIQWTFSSRKQLLYDNTKGKGASIADISHQMNVVIDELRSYGLENELKAVPETLEGAKTAAYIFCTKFENPKDAEERAQERQDGTDKFWEMYESGALSAASSGQITSGKLNWPTDTHNITSNYGNRLHPLQGTFKFHNGIDIAEAGGNSVNMGKPIYAAEGGYVKAYNPDPKGFGTFIVIHHDNLDKLETMYAHLSAALVSPGAQVVRGQIIGRMGSSGGSTGAHLHFGVYPEGYNNNAGITKNPLDYLT